MSDWLMSDDDSSGSDGGYLGMALDDPAPPDSAPTPPTQAAPAGDPLAGGFGDWLGDDDASGVTDGFGDSGAFGAPAGAPTGGQSTGTSVMDDQGGWFGTGAAPAPIPAPQQQGYGQQSYGGRAPMATSQSGEFQVSAPMLDEVHAGQRTAGGRKGELSSLVLDVEVQVEVGLGNAALTVEEFLEMGRGSIVELDTPVDAPIELKVRGKLIARGQLVSINGSYGMRIVEMVNEDS
jgi:flagellar motor switch protein FliN/FliY